MSSRITTAHIVVSPYPTTISATRDLSPMQPFWRVSLNSGGYKRSFGGSEGDLSNRSAPGVRLGRTRLLHGSKSGHRGSAAGGRSWTSSHARPLQASPEAVFGVSNAFSIPAPQEGIQRLSQFLWDYLAADEQGSPRRVGIGPYPQSVFYASAGTYNLGHTCNAWTAEALGVAGLPVTASGVVFAGQVLDQLPPVLEPVTNAQSEH